MVSRHGDALAAQAVTELLEDAWHEGSAERTLDLYGPPRRTLAVRTRLIDDGRRPLGVIAIIEDVSERRRLEEIRRDFVANVSHELKTPMGALGLLAETLRRARPRGGPAPGRPHPHRGLPGQPDHRRPARPLPHRVRGGTAPRAGLVNLVMAEAIERVRAPAEQRRITIELDEPDPPVPVLGDRRQLVSAMHSLLENAVTYSYEDATVQVVRRARPNGEIRLLGGRHRGRHPRPGPRPHLRALLPGRPRAQPRHRRHRARALHRPPRGQQPPGLGRGRVPRGRGVDVHPGPAHPGGAPGVTKDRRARRPKQGRTAAPARARIKVLLAEDEESFIDALVIGLTREGFEVTVARDGTEALRLFDEVEPDLVLLDLMLPKLSGIDVCRAIRARSPVPIIMVTAKGTEIDTVVGLEVGADDYVTKPYRLRELVARMRAVLRRTPPGGRPSRSGRRGRARVEFGRATASGSARAAGSRSTSTATGSSSAARRSTCAARSSSCCALLMENAGPGADPRRAHRPGLGHRLHRRHQDARRAHQAAALPHRGRPLVARAHHHRPRRRLPLRRAGASVERAATRWRRPLERAGMTVSPPR